MSYDQMPRFKNLIMKRYGINNIEGVKDPLSKMYLDFALSTVGRGELVKNIISQHLDIKGKKYLDIGCAYGGFLASFEKAGAINVTGIDVNEQLLDYSKAIIEDCKLSAQVFKKDILNLEEVLPLGKFDLITCNDVIEHVEDPKVGLANMVTMLNEKGTLFMQIPNRLSASFIKSDGHFQLFGISILPKLSADKYYNKIYPDRKHDVTYKSLNYYINNLRQLGLECSVINTIQQNKEERLKIIFNTFEECERLINEDNINVPADLKDTIVKRTLKVSNLFKQQYGKYQDIKNKNTNSSDILADKLIQKFGEDFWVILARTPEYK
ncbi:MAG: methyltransferase domain-containing protein [Aminipila sp.]